MRDAGRWPSRCGILYPSHGGSSLPSRAIRSWRPHPVFPWFVIAVIHQRESSQDWGSSLAQGDAWDKVSVHVPAGRGPFKSWEEAAIDALVHCPPHAARNDDWSTGGALTKLEEYNGLDDRFHETNQLKLPGPHPEEPGDA
jgi:lysozyme family protein